MIAKANKPVQYYLVKDRNLNMLFFKLLTMDREVHVSINALIYSYVPSAVACNIRTEGNLQIKFLGFDWRFKNIKHIPEDMFICHVVSEKEIIATPDVDTIKGKKLASDVSELLNTATVDCYQLWSGEIAPLLGWKSTEEPGVLYNALDNVIILVTASLNTSSKLFTPPLGVIYISKTRVELLLQPFH